MTFADEIRQAVKDAKKAGISRYQIAEDTGISQQQLSRFVNGKQWFAEETLNALAEYLGLRVKKPPTEQP
jgi:transcriptional regulator with XRE-family HTH domain